jgi:hypothetical protein
MPDDTGLTCVNLLGVFFFGAAVQQEGFSLTAQYVLVSNLSTAIQRFKEDALPITWALALVPVMLGGEKSDLAALAQLVTVETFTGWIRDLLPKGALLASTLLLLYMAAPFVNQFPLLRRLSRFAVFAVANDNQTHSTPPWLVATGLWAIWIADTKEDGVGRNFAATAGANVTVLVVLDAVRFAMDNDPAPVLISLLVSIRILEKQSF